MPRLRRSRGVRFVVEPLNAAVVQSDAAVLMAGLDAGSVDLVLTDPPYGITRNPWDLSVDWPSLWPLVWRALKPSGAALVFGQTKSAMVMLQSSLEHFRYDLVWEKSRPVGFYNARRQPLRAHEQVFVFYRQQPTYNPQMVKGAPVHGIGRAQSSPGGLNYGNAKRTDRLKRGDPNLKFPRSVFRFTKPHPPVHPTQKPVDLCEMLIRTYTNIGDLVVDPYAGSGTSLAAALACGRRCIAGDLNAASP